MVQTYIGIGMGYLSIGIHAPRSATQTLSVVADLPIALPAAIASTLENPGLNPFGATLPGPKIEAIPADYQLALMACKDSRAPRACDDIWGET